MGVDKQVPNFCWRLPGVNLGGAFCTAGRNCAKISPPHRPAKRSGKFADDETKLAKL